MGEVSINQSDLIERRERFCVNGLLFVMFGCSIATPYNTVIIFLIHNTNLQFTRCGVVNLSKL
jgi:hypothetical protein